MAVLRVYFSSVGAGPAEPACSRGPDQAPPGQIERVEEVKDDEQLQGHWRSMEKRVLHRKTKKDGPRGRKGLRSTAWDAEHV
jgi:hypothetical protein